MSGDFEERGWWWLPETPQHRVPGFISWSPHDAGLLRLVGQLVPDVVDEEPRPDGTTQRRRRRADFSSPIPLIHGESAQDAYTLTNCFRTASVGWSTSMPSEDVFAGKVIKGAWMPDPEITVDHAWFKIRGLTEWVNITGFDVGSEPDPRDHGHLFGSARLRSHDSIDMDCEGTRIRLVHSVSESIGLAETSLGQAWILGVEATEPTPLAQLIGFASHVQDLLTIATGVPATFDSVKLTHPDVRYHLLDGAEGERRELDYFSTWLVRRKPNDAEVHPSALMNFSFGDLRIDGLKRWLATAEEFRGELNRVMATKYSDKMFLDDRIMNLCSVIDAFGRGALGESFYAARLDHVLDQAGTEFQALIPEGREAFRQRVKKLRNMVAHHEYGPARTLGAGHAIAADQLYWLCILYLLHQAQAPAAVFRRLDSSADWKWMQRRAEELIDPHAVGEPSSTTDARDSD